MYDYSRTKKADHPGDLSPTEFFLGYARAFGTHLMDELNKVSGNRWWFNKVNTRASGFYELDFQMLAGAGRLPMTVWLKMEPHGVVISIDLPYGGRAEFGGHPDNKPSLVASQIGHRLKDSFTAEAG